MTTLLMAWLGVSIVINRHLELRRQAEDALAEEKERLSVTLRSIGEGVITTDLSGKVNLMNRVAENLQAGARKTQSAEIWKRYS